MKDQSQPFKRAATHVAISYFIYIKSVIYKWCKLEQDNLQNLEKNQLDPTYNARLLREKKNVNPNQPASQNASQSQDSGALHQQQPSQHLAQQFGQ